MSSEGQQFKLTSIENNIKWDDQGKTERMIGGEDELREVDQTEAFASLGNQETEELNIFGKPTVFQSQIITSHMRSRQRKTYRPHEEPQTTTGSPLPHARQDHSRSKQGIFKQSPPQASVRLNQKEKLQRLMHENKELKKQLMELKVNQFYHFDDSKLKKLIEEVQELRKEVKKNKDQICELQLQNDFLTRTNVHLKRELEKQIEDRKKSLRRQEARSTHGKQTDRTLNTDCSRNTQQEISHLTYNSSNAYFTQNTIIEDIQGTRDILKGMDYLSGAQEASQEIVQRHPRKSLMQKILSPRRGKEKSPALENNEYLLYRRQKDKKTVLS